MSGRMSRRKGVRGELEVAKIMQAHGFDCRRTPNSGGLAIKGDLAGVDGYHFEVKRAETLAVPRWLQQAHDDAGDLVPVLVFRRDARTTNDATGQWHAVIELSELARLLAREAS